MVTRLLVKDCAALGRDPGPMTAAESSSHHVYVSSDVVVKVIDAARHSRLDREVTLAPHLPAGLTASLLGSGFCRLGTREVRYACYTRLAGAAPGMGLPGVDSATPRVRAEQGVQRPDGLAAIAERAPLSARTVVPVHADCHWGYWLACDQDVTALLDFEMGSTRRTGRRLVLPCPVQRSAHGDRSRCYRSCDDDLSRHPPVTVRGSRCSARRLRPPHRA